MGKKITLEEILIKLQNKHNNLYDYSLVTEYINKYTLLSIICSIHGIFTQEYRVHASGSGCQKCANDLKKKNYTKEEKLKRNREYIKEYRDKQKIANGYIKKEVKSKEDIALWNKEYHKEYYLKNKKRILKCHTLNRQKRLENDPLFRLTTNIRKRIYVSLKEKGYSKKTRTTNILGCSFEEFKKFLEDQFTEGMNWNNYGKWHLDHIIPISSAKTEEEVLKLNNYLNFQPLWAIDNMKKGNRI